MNFIPPSMKLIPSFCKAKKPADGGCKCPMANLFHAHKTIIVRPLTMKFPSAGSEYRREDDIPVDLFIRWLLICWFLDLVIECSVSFCLRASVLNDYLLSVVYDSQLAEYVFGTENILQYQGQGLNRRVRAIRAYWFYFFISPITIALFLLVVVSIGFSSIILS